MWAWAAAICCCSATSASGQDSTLSTYPALFGRNPSNTQAQHVLDASATFGEAYDDDLNADLAGRPLPIDRGGFYNSASGRFDYSLRSERLQVGITGAAAVRYYGLGHEFVNIDNGVGAGLSTRLGQRTTLWVNEAVAYAPVFLYGLFASGASPVLGQVVTTPASYDVNIDRSFASTTFARLSQGLTSRTAIAFSGEVRTTNFTGASKLPDMGSRNGGVQFDYQSSRNTGLRFSYNFIRADYNQTAASEHDLNVGFDVRKPLSRTRTATVSVTAGLAQVKDPAIFGARPNARQYRLSLDALLAYPISRAWYFETSFRRGVGYIEGLSAPVFIDAFRATASGFLNARTELSFSGGYSAGDWFLGSSTSNLATYTVDARFQFAVTRMWAANVEYLYYVYRFDGGAPFAGAPAGLTRNGVRAGIALWVPLVRR